MVSRLLITAAAVFASFAFAVESQAQDEGRIHMDNGGHRHHRQCCAHVGGYRNFTIVGPGYWAPNLYDTLPPSAWSDTRCYPGFYNCQTFWDRVETQRNYPVQY